MLSNKGETITRVNGNVSFTAGKRLQNVSVFARSFLDHKPKGQVTDKF